MVIECTSTQVIKYPQLLSIQVHTDVSIQASTVMEYTCTCTLTYWVYRYPQQQYKVSILYGTHLYSVYCLAVVDTHCCCCYALSPLAWCSNNFLLEGLVYVNIIYKEVNYRDSVCPLWHHFPFSICFLLVITFETWYSSLHIMNSCTYSIIIVWFMYIYILSVMYIFM